MTEKCKGTKETRAAWDGRKFKTKWFKASDKAAKAEAIHELISKMSRYDIYNPCKGDCDKKGHSCEPVSVSLSIHKKEPQTVADLGLAEVTMFGEKRQAYFFEVKKGGYVDLDIKCACIPIKKTDKPEKEKSKKKSDKNKSDKKKNYKK